MAVPFVKTANIPVAGLTSASHGKVTGLIYEPPIQHKRRCGPQSTNPLCNDDGASPEFILLGDQHKFATNVPYKLQGGDGKQTQVQPQMKEEERKEYELLPAAPQIKFDSGKPAASPTKQPKKAHNAEIKVIAGSIDKLPTKTKGKSPKKKMSIGAKTKPSVSKEETANVNNNNAEEDTEAAQSKARPTGSDIDKHLEYVMKYRAGLGPQRKSVQRRSEYQKMFAWRKPEAKTTPILAANKVVYNNNPQVISYPNSAHLSSTTEYRNQYKAWSAKKINKPSGPEGDKENLNFNNNNNNNNNNNEKTGDSNIYNDNNEKDMASRVEKGGVTAESDKTKASKAADIAKQVPTPVRTAGLPSKTDHEPKVKQTSQSADSPVKVSVMTHSPRAWLSEYKLSFKPNLRPAQSKYAPDQSTSKTESAKKQAADVGQPSLTAQRSGAPLVARISKSDIPLTECIVKSVSALQGEQQLSADWFSEVRELREKAHEYRRRARGMHFSREHVGQLLAEQAKLWDELSVSSADDMVGTGAQKQQPAKLGKPAEKTKSILGKTNIVTTEKSESESTIKATVGSEGSDNSLGLSSENGFISSASQQKPPESMVRDAGTHRLAWSCDGDRSPSLSDTVRSIRSGHSDIPAAAGKTKDEVRASSYVPARSPTKTKSKAEDDCDCESETNKQVGRALCPSPTAGLVVRDSHHLIDETTQVPDKDQILQTRFVLSPDNQRKKKKTPGLRAVTEGAADTYKVAPVPKNKSASKLHNDSGDYGDDLNHASLLSASMISLASSTSSLASDLLDRAEKRRNEFWGKRGKQSRK